MTKKDTPKKADNNAKNIGIGVGLTTAAVAAAGAFFLYGSKNAAKNRKQVKSWALKAKAEVLEKLEDAQQMTEKEYNELIKSVTGAYTGVKNASKKDIMELTKELKDHWQAIEKAAAPLKKETKKAAKVAKKETVAAVKETKTTVKKVAKKATDVAKKVAK